MRGMRTEELIRKEMAAQMTARSMSTIHLHVRRCHVTSLIASFIGLWSARLDCRRASSGPGAVRPSQFDSGSGAPRAIGTESAAHVQRIELMRKYPPGILIPGKAGTPASHP